MSRLDINPLELVDDLADAINEIDQNGVNGNLLTLPATNVLSSPAFPIDYPDNFLKGEGGGVYACAAFVNSVPTDVKDRGAGISTLQFVILISVSKSDHNPDMEISESCIKVNQLLYALQRRLQGWPSATGYNWAWAGHGLVPDAEASNSSLAIYQQVWQVKHGYMGYEG